MYIFGVPLMCSFTFGFRGSLAASLSAANAENNLVCQNGQVYDSSGTSFNTTCNAEWRGNDLQVMFATDFFSCIDECSAWNNGRPADDIERCAGVAWARDQYSPPAYPNTNACYLKWSMPAGHGQYNSVIDSAQVLNNSPTSTTSKATTSSQPSSSSLPVGDCPEYNGSTWTTSGSASDAQFKIACGNDWDGGDMHINFTSDLFECLGQCANTTWPDGLTCFGVAWEIDNYGPRGPSGGHTCYFKWNMTGPGTPKSYVDAAIQLSPVESSTVPSKVNPPPTPSTSGSVATSPSVSSGSSSAAGTVGELVGGIAGALAVAVAIWKCWTRREKRY